MLHWEQIKHDKAFYILRAKVFNGWLVTTIDDVITPVNTGYNQPDYEQGFEWRTSITFVPDPNHEWKLEENG